MRSHVVWRVEALTHVRLGNGGNRAVVFIPGDAASSVLAGDLPSLEIERVAITVVRRITEHGDSSVVVNPAALDAHGDVAPHQVLALATPCWPFRPHAACP